MANIENDCFHLSRSQGMSDLRESIGKYDTMLILRGFAPTGKTSVVT